MNQLPTYLEKTNSNMEDYDMFEDENSEWMKGLQLVKDFANSENALQDYMQTLENSRTPVLDSTEELLYRSATVEVKQHSREDLSEWDCHARNSPFQTAEITNSSRSHRPRRSYSFDAGITTPVMVESYLPTSHGVIRITFPSQRTYDAHDDHISEIVQTHLSSYYHFAHPSKRSQSLPSFPTTPANFDPEFEHHSTTTPKEFRSNQENHHFISTSSSTTNLSSQSTTPEFSHDMKIDANNADYYSLFCSDSSDEGSNCCGKNRTPENGTPNFTKRKTRTGRRKHSKDTIDENAESLVKEGGEENIDEQLDDEHSDDDEDEDENFDEDEEDDSDSYSSTRRKRRRVRKASSSADSSLQPRRKASAYARNVLMDWLVEHEGKALQQCLAYDLTHI